MATYDIVILSSSPPAAAKHHATPSRQRVGMSAFSPVAVSPFASPTRRPPSALRPGSRAAAIPGGASREFATARSLVKSHHFSPGPDDEFGGIHDAQPRGNSRQDPGEMEEPAKKPRKRPTKIATAGDAGDAAEPKPKKPRARKPKADNSADGITVDSNGQEPKPKPRKPRAKKDKMEDGTSGKLIEKTNIQKPKAAAKPRAKAQKKTTGVVSGHFGTGISGGDGGDAGSREQSSGVHIPEGDIWESGQAVTRRLDWTPVKDTRTDTAFTDSLEEENSTSAPPPFTSMLSTFSFANTEPPADASKTTTMATTGGMKKRRLELIDIPANRSASRSTSPEKNKAPKKKPRTITDLVTEQYAQKDIPANPSPTTSEFFSPRTSTTKVPLNDADGGKAPSKPSRKRATSKTAGKGDSKSKKASAKGVAKPKMVADKLLSPASARLKMNKQDILFGTSSQLAMEESPTMVRQIQQAIRESEQDADDLQLGELSRSGIMHRLGKTEGKRRLWAASARDEDGQLLERQDPVYIPEPDRTQDIPLLLDGTTDAHNESFLDIDDFELPPKRTSPVLPSASLASLSVSQSQRSTIMQDIIDNDDYPEPPPSNQQATSSFFDIDDILPSKQPLRSPSPFASSPFLNIDDILPPSQPVTSTSASSRPLPASVAISSSPKEKPRGRPPKSASAVPKTRLELPKKPKAKKLTQDLPPPRTPPKSSRYADIEEILDSQDDEALSPTPPRPSKVPPLPLPLVSSGPSPKTTKAKGKAIADTDPDLVPVFKVPAAQLLWDGIKPRIFSAITAHIRSLPPTTDPKNPSWHEKILMYDPIVCEEFTAYLNAKTSIRTYKKATVKQVKAWNKKIKGEGGDVLVVEDDGDMVLVVEKEIEGLMVQGWCQEMSVCCISKEGKKSGVRKGYY